MVSDWPSIENDVGMMHSDGDNGADLFGGDLFGDELLDLYSPSEAGGHDIPHVMDQHEMNSSNVKNAGLSMIKTSPSLNDFTSILEQGHTPIKETTLSVDTTTTNGKKRVANEQPPKVPATKKKATGKANLNIGVSNTPAKRTSPGKNENEIKDFNKVNNAKETKKGPIGAAVKAQPSKPVIQKNGAVQPNVQNIQPAQATQASSYPAVKTPTLAPAVSKNPMDSSNSVGSGKTEESFKGVAQAAVNNLILSAGQTAGRYDGTKNDPLSKTVNTSTSHVAALTSNNWVAACAASMSDVQPGTAEAAQAAALAAASDPAAAKAARARRATLTADERARQNRDRNREHARNTRLRKKAYVEELKRTLTELVTARDTAELERRHEKQRDLEVREVRFRVMEEFLKLRARGTETNLLARWVAILEDGFTLTLPSTEYREMVNYRNGMVRQVSENSDALNDPSQQVLRGATECFDDASKVAAFLQSLSAGNLTQSYICDRKKFMMDDINAMLEWTFTCPNMGNGSNLVVRGCMRATFSPASNKLVCAELLFDTGGVASQVKSMMPYQDTLNNNASGLPCIAETDALLDSVLPQASSAISTKSERNLPCSVSVVSTDKSDTSSDEGEISQPVMKQEQSN